MSDFTLIPHPAFPPRAVRHVAVSLQTSSAGWWLTYAVGAPPSALRLPQPSKPYRADELWRTTCFELFALTESKGYCEFNFSTSSAWAAYRFDDYRKGMMNLSIDTEPRISVFDEACALRVSVTVDPVPAAAALALAAIVEEAGGTKSYWALTHPGEKPDFHHPDSFLASLRAP